MPQAPPLTARASSRARVPLPLPFRCARVTRALAYFEGRVFAKYLSRLQYLGMSGNHSYKWW